MTTTEPSPGPARPADPADRALFDAVATEHGIIYGYGLVSAHSTADDNALVSAAIAEHRDRREAAIAMLTARSVSAPLPASGYQLPIPLNNPTDAANLARFKVWWRRANIEQLVSFWFICIFSIMTFSLLAHSTIGGQQLTTQANLAFIKAEGEALQQVVAPWFGKFFWVFGSMSLVLVALGTVDYIARIVADILRTVYLQGNELWSESRIYFYAVWAGVISGSVILLSGVQQPLVLLMTAACLNGLVMVVYGVLLIQLNLRGLPPALRIGGLRLVMLALATAFYAFFGGWLVIAQVRAFLGM